MLRTHCQTSGVSLAEQDPYNNVVRTAYEAMSAVLGGTQSLHTNALDEAIALPTDFSARIARNTQLILQEETGVTNVVDPLAGLLLRRGPDRRTGREGLGPDRGGGRMGGMTKAVASGMPKLRIEETAARRQAMIDRGEEVIVGVNKYRKDHEDPIDILDVDNVKVRQSQVDRLERIRAAATRRLRRGLVRTATPGAATAATFWRLAVEAARARATVGEISDAMERVFGRHRAEVKTLAGVYGAAYGRCGLRAIQSDVDAFAEDEAGARACWWSRWDRTATTAAPR